MAPMSSRENNVAICASAGFRIFRMKWATRWRAVPKFRSASQSSASFSACCHFSINRLCRRTELPPSMLITDSGMRHTDMSVKATASLSYCDVANASSPATSPGRSTRTMRWRPSGVTRTSLIIPVRNVKIPMAAVDSANRMVPARNSRSSIGEWIMPKSCSFRSANRTMSRMPQLRQSEVPFQADSVLMGIIACRQASVVAL
jgi:hypothetical protein